MQALAPEEGLKWTQSQWATPSSYFIFLEENAYEMCRMWFKKKKIYKAQQKTCGILRAICVEVVG